MPNTNLVSNIRFAKDALYTSCANSPLSVLDTGNVLVGSKRLSINQNVKTDKFSMKNVFNFNVMNVIKQKLHFILFK